MEHLARKEIWRKDEALKHVEVLLEAQNARVLLLESQARESAAMIQERESAFMEERACMATQLDARRAELRQLVPPDTHTDAEVMQLVRNLNVQISQTATLLTDTFTPVADVEAQRASAEFTEAHERARHAVGPIMAELLESINHEDDPILVHIALQTDIVGFAAGIISSWDFQHQSNSTFAGIHKQMLKSESQNVAGRWRALTRQYSKQRLYQGRDLSEGFTTQLAERMCDILTVSGARASVADMRHSVFRNFATVVRLALELQEVIGEGVTSRDLDVVVVRMDDVFVPETMEDVYGGPGTGEQEQLHVLCTAALGLRRCEKPADGLGDELQVSTLVKPKVVLETLVYELGLVEEDEPDTEDNMIV
ncbi:hypothetical protein WOLCODRAFT_28714 [Wolfiporia cocos MD-104 SS10]|uniref:Uncharacterized protein n=1 Tax=Wolfiporia cocos (strain MD-104) TaxID=742152 RepID=A0A2H3JKY5_WOLCO|nr:hypothetical protein WOLCODRAFT_28714 [Wolfiporia cocos MD-104 SS10]